MSFKSLTSNCCKNKADEENLYQFSNSTFGNLAGNKFIDLAELLTPKCEGNSGCLVLSGGESKDLSGAMLSLVSPENNVFLISKSLEERENNSTIVLDSTSSIEGQVTTFDFTVSFTNDLVESTYAWDTFHSLPYNTNITNWNETSGSWDFYSTTNSTTNISVIEDYISETLQMQVVGVEPTKGDYLFVDGVGNEITLTICFDGVDFGIQSILVGGNLTVDSTKILDPVVSGSMKTYTVFYRGIISYDPVCGFYIVNYGHNKSIRVYNRGEEPIQINTLVAFVCDTTIETGDCGCGCGC